MKYVSIVLLLLFLVQALNAQSFTNNFNFSDVIVYGVDEADTSSTILALPYDFILTPEGYPIVVDTTGGRTFEFFEPFLRNYTLLDSNNEFTAVTHQSPGNYLVVSFRALYTTTDFINFTQINITTSDPSFEGIAYDSSSNSVYISDANSNEVIVYNLADLSINRVYGDSSSPTLDSRLSSPELLAIDNKGGLWVADALNNRVLHFPANSTLPDIVLGQSNFNTSTQGSVSDSSSLLNPNGVVLDASNQNLYVSDQTGRVLRFTAPFTNGQAASGVLDATFDFESYNIYSVRLYENYTDGTVRLFYLDAGKGKVVSGRIDVPTPAASLSSTSTASASVSASPSASASASAPQSASGSAAVSSTASPSVSVRQSSSSSVSFSATSSVSLSISTTQSATPSTTAQAALPSETPSSSISLSVSASASASSVSSTRPSVAASPSASTPVVCPPSSAIPSPVTCVAPSKTPAPVPDKCITADNGKVTINFFFGDVHTALKRGY